jgi:hypothetical protein
MTATANRSAGRVPTALFIAVLTLYLAFPTRIFTGMALDLPW